VHLPASGRERRRDAVPSLTLKISRVLLIDVSLFFRRRIGAGDVEVPILHDNRNSYSAARLAAARELGVAARQRGGLCFLVSAFPQGPHTPRNPQARPPLRLGARRQNDGETSHRGQ